MLRRGAPRACIVACLGAPGPLGLNLGPLSEAGKLREAAEASATRCTGSGHRPNAGNAADAGHAPPVRRQIAAAQRFRRQGVGLLRAGKLPAAITALRQATRLDPADAGSHRALGLALLRSGRLAEATAILELAIALEEGVAIAHYRLAVAFDRQGLTEKAIAAYRRAVELMPEMAEGHRRLSGHDDRPANEIDALLLDGDPRQAEALVRQAIALDPASDRLHKALGVVLALDGRFDEAIAAFDGALDLNPREVSAHHGAVRRRNAPKRTAPASTGCWRRSQPRHRRFPPGIPPFRDRQGVRRSG